MFGFGYNIPFNKGGRAGVTPFSPLDYSPTFWFDYSKYSAGALAGGEVDETGDYTITPFNSAIIGSDGTNNALSTNGSTNSYAVSYGSTFGTQLSQPHTHVIFYKPKAASRTLDAICGSRDLSIKQYTLVHVGQKLRLLITIGGVNNQFNTLNDVILNTNYLSIVVKVQQSGVTIEVNGVNQPLDNTSFTSTLSDFSTITSNFYTGARNNNGTIDIPSNCYIGDHLLFPSILTTAETTKLLNYFI